MKQLFIEKFANYRPALADNLSRPDYEDTGCTDLVQLRESIESLVDELGIRIEDSFMDWILLYTF